MPEFQRWHEVFHVLTTGGRTLPCLRLRACQRGGEGESAVVSAATSASSPSKGAPPPTSTPGDVCVSKLNQFQHCHHCYVCMCVCVCASLFSIASPAELQQASVRSVPPSDYSVHACGVHRVSQSGHQVNFRRGKLERHRWVSLKKQFWTVASYSRSRRLSVGGSVLGGRPRSRGAFAAIRCLRHTSTTAICTCVCVRGSCASLGVHRWPHRVRTYVRMTRVRGLPLHRA